MSDSVNPSIQPEDFDPDETHEWIESIDSVLRVHGAERAQFLLNQMVDHARRSGAYLPFRPNTAYLNTIPLWLQPEYPGDRAIERRIEAYLRWNAMAMVVRANKDHDGIGGHRRTVLERGGRIEREGLGEAILGDGVAGRQPRGELNGVTNVAVQRVVEGFLGD